jgi:predicted glycosyltransferase
MDEPEIALAEWHGNGNEQFVRDHFDAIWIYGDKSVYDTTQACRIADDLQQRSCFTGYLDQRPRLQLWECRDNAVSACRLVGNRPFVLGVVGGGQDGEALALAFAHSRFPEGRTGVLVTGPYLPPAIAQELRAVASRRNDLTVIDFCPEVDVLLSRADRVVSMGGYNSICSILSYDRPALVVPRVWPRREQHLRAARMQEMGLFDVLHPAELSADALSNWFHRSPDAVSASSRINLDGLQSIQSFLLQYFSQSMTSRTIAC